MRKKLLTFAAVLLGTILSACGGYSAGYYSYGPPPAPRYGAIGYAPGPGYVWVDGYWNRGSRNWAWVNGYWTRPPRAHSSWVRSEWRNDGGRWRFHRGHWR